jgi:hypothetical protein
VSDLRFSLIAPIAAAPLVIAYPGERTELKAMAALITTT